MMKQAQTKPSICRCGANGSYEIKEDNLPEGVKDSFNLCQSMYENWEALYQCRTCGQNWHQSTSGKFDEWIIYSKVSKRNAAELIKKEKVASLAKADRIASALNGLETKSKPK